MKRAFVLLLVAALGVPSLSACSGAAASDLTIEELPVVSPTLPAVPTIPPPPHPIQYPDQSYSVFGLRRRMAVTMDSDVTVTGYIVQIYAAPECPTGRTCPQPAAPHLFIADTAGETDETKLLMVAGYAENQQQIDEAVELARRGRYEPPAPETGLLPTPTDFFVGNKILVQGRFIRISGSGFNVSEGLIEYRGHTTQTMTPEATEALSLRRGR